MPGYILLAGGAEFQPGMDSADRRAIELAGGPDAPIRIIPAAAAPDNNHTRAGANATAWFTSLGARDVAVVELIDRASAASPAVVVELSGARLIYLLGGFVRHLGESLMDSPAWSAIQAAHAGGAVVAGSSAGAMALCSVYYHPLSRQLVNGLGLVPAVCVLPHHNGFGAEWAEPLATQLPLHTLLGLDERTAVIDDAGDPDPWRVYGPGQAVVYRGGVPSAYRQGELLTLP